MKKVFLLMVTAATLVACNNNANTVSNEKDSLDSIANAKKDMIDSTANEKKEKIDSTTDKMKNTLDQRDSAMRTHESDTAGKNHSH